MKTFTMKAYTHAIVPRKTMKDKIYHLNINNYRNWHHSVEGQIKIEYQNYIKELLIGCPVFDKPVNVEVQLYRLLNKDGSFPKTSKDKHNVNPILMKYVYDAITENGNWIDDDDTIVKKETMLPAIWLEKNKGDMQYAIITITEIE